MGKENPKIRWKMQRGRNWWEGKNREEKGWGIGIKLLIFIFLELLFYVLKKCTQESESP
jgi:hypothetical protein